MHTQRLDSRTIVVTGATSGIGYFVAEGLADLGARIIVAARSVQKANAVLELLPGSDRHRHLPFDLSDIESVRAAGRQIAAEGPIDGLVMNAGIIGATPHFTRGPFDVESTAGLNVLAHLEFLRLAMPALQQAPAARIVSVGSMLTRKIPFDRSAWLSRDQYHPRRAYAMSKHAAEILGFELDRRLRADASHIASVVTHPGGAIDALTPDRPPLHQRSAWLRVAAATLGPLSSRLVQGKDVAAQPAIAAIAAPALPAMSYIGPSRAATGNPALARPVATSTDPELGRWLWRETERILGNRIYA